MSQEARMVVVYNVISSSSQWEAVPAGPGLDGARVTWKLTPRKRAESWISPKCGLVCLITSSTTPEPWLSCCPFWKASLNPARLRPCTSSPVLLGHASLSQQRCSECVRGRGALASTVGILSSDTPLDLPFQNLWGWSRGTCIFTELHRCR